MIVIVVLPYGMIVILWHGTPVGRYGLHGRVFPIPFRVLVSRFPLFRVFAPRVLDYSTYTLFCVPPLLLCFSSGACCMPGFNEVESALPFAVEGHPSAKSHVAREMLRRLKEDVQYFANEVSGISILFTTYMHSSSSSRIKN